MIKKKSVFRRIVKNTNREKIFSDHKIVASGDAIENWCLEHKLSSESKRLIELVECVFFEFSRSFKRNSAKDIYFIIVNGRLPNDKICFSSRAITGDYYIAISLGFLKSIWESTELLFIVHANIFSRENGYTKAFEIIILHEYAHIYLGHIDYLTERKYCQNAIKSRLIRHALEWDADSYAAKNTLGRILNNITDANDFILNHEVISFFMDSIDA